MKIVILGSSAVQLDTVEYLLKNKCEIHILSNREPSNSRNEEFIFTEIDICNRKKVMEYCLDNKIDALYSVGSDFGLLTSSYVCEQIGLSHFIPFQSAQLMQNKKEFRQFLHTNNISLLPFKIALNTEDLHSWDIFPCVVKPVDSQGQRGVSIIEAESQINQAFQTAFLFSSSKEVIIEKFISGNEISVNVFVENGEIEHFFITDRIIAKGTKMGIPFRHIIPSSIPEHLTKDVFSMCKSVIEKIGINNGPVYFQMKYDGDSINIIEATPRLDGCHLWRLILFNSGVNILEKTLNKVIGIKDENHINTSKNGRYFIEFRLQKPGEQFSEKENEYLYRVPYYQPGETIRSVNGVLEKTAMYIKS